MKPSDFVTTSGQKSQATQSLLQTELTDAVNSGIVGRADKSERSLKSSLYTAGKKAAVGGASSAAIAAVTASRKSGTADTADMTGVSVSPETAGAAGVASGTVSSSGTSHTIGARTSSRSASSAAGGAYAGSASRTSAGSSIPRGGSGSAKSAAGGSGVRDSAGTPGGGSAAQTRGGRRSGTDFKTGFKASLRSAAIGGAVRNTLRNTEFDGADDLYYKGKGSYRLVRGIHRRIGGRDALASNGKSLGALSEKKSQVKTIQPVEAKRKAQAVSYFKRTVYTTAEKAKTTTVATKSSLVLMKGGMKSFLAAISSGGAPILFFLLGFLLMLLLLISVIGGQQSTEDEVGFGNLTGVQLEVAQALSDEGLGAAQIAAIMGSISGESAWNPTAEYNPGDGEYGYGLFQFTDNPSDGTRNYTNFVNWCNANGMEKSSVSAQVQYFLQVFRNSWNTALHRSGYYAAEIPEYAGMDASYSAWLASNDVGFATYCFMACYERPADWAAETSFYNTRLPAAQAFYAQLSGGNGQDYSAANETQRAIVDAAKRTPTTGAGWCAAWVSNVYANAGLGSVSGNACCMYLNYCTSSDRSELEVGMLIAVQESPTSYGNWNYGHTGYGHVGIYIGDNLVMHNSGSVQTTDLNEWISTYGTRSQARWGYPPNVV